MIRPSSTSSDAGTRSSQGLTSRTRSSEMPGGESSRRSTRWITRPARRYSRQQEGRNSTSVLAPRSLLQAVCTRGRRPALAAPPRTERTGHEAEEAASSAWWARGSPSGVDGSLLQVETSARRACGTHWIPHSPMAVSMSPAWRTQSATGLHTSRDITTVPPGGIEPPHPV